MFFVQTWKRYQSSHLTLNKKANKHTFQSDISSSWFVIKHGCFFSIEETIFSAHLSNEITYHYLVLPWVSLSPALLLDGLSLIALWISRSLRSFLLSMFSKTFWKKYRFWHCFLVALERITSFKYYISNGQFFLQYRETHLECFSLLTNVSIKLLCVFAVSSQLWSYVEVLIL